MGSSKKHREKERESRKRRHRSHSKERERERSREQSTSTKDKHAKERRNRSKSRERDRKRPREDFSDKPRVKYDRKEKNDEGDEMVVGPSAGGDISLSIEETNKLRAKLGLKPLEVNDADDNENVEEKKLEFVHMPAENLSDKLEMQKIREKIEMIKEKRRLAQKLNKIKSLGDSDSETEDAHSWVSKSRITEEERKRAQARAKLLEEMDDEFGVGNMVEDELNMLKSKVYTDRNLKGLKVEHDQKSFKEGKAVILTLKDQGVLGEDDDVLVNVNMVDDERTTKNNELRKQKKTYNPLSDEESDSDSDANGVLQKYNEEIEGAKKKSFVIGGGREPVNFEKKKEKKGGVSLELPTPQLAKEFYTEEEMVQFKKSSKKVRKVKKKKLKADDLLVLPTNQKAKKNPDLGSRSRGKPVEEEDNDIACKTEKSKSPPPPPSSSWNRFSRAESPDLLGPDEDVSNIVLEVDEAEDELQLMLHKTRKIKQMENLKSGADKVVKVLSTLSEQPEIKTEGGKGHIILNDTAEFCRALGDIPTYGQSGNRDEDVDELMDFEREPAEERVPLPLIDDMSNKGSWNEVDLTSKPKEVKMEDVTILEEEPDVSVGIAGALQLAMRKGYLDKEAKKIVSAPRHSLLEAKAYTIEDKAMLEDERVGRRDRFTAGPVSDFKDKDGYRPDIKLEYMDDNGRFLCPKEAFRHLSHKFHGKGSGKNKTEKRLKKLQEETLMKQMSSTDTPLGTLSLLQQKQRQTQSAYVVLSGGSKSINWSSISKK